MSGRARAVPLAVGVTAVILLGSAALLRRASPERPPRRGSAVAADRGDAAPGIVARRGVASGAEARRDPAPDPEVERIFRQYRVALSTHDRSVEDALYPVLLAHREAALDAARRDAAEASSPEERDWAERAVRFLSDPPVPPPYRRPRRDP